MAKSKGPERDLMIQDFGFVFIVRGNTTVSEFLQLSIQGVSDPFGT